MEEDIDEIKKSLDFMSEKISQVAKQQATLMGLMTEIKQLKNLVGEKDKKKSTNWSKG